MVDHAAFVTWISLFASAAVIVFFVEWRLGRSTGLVAAYGLELIVLHWLAPALYLFPDYTNLDPVVVLAGLKESTYGFLGFALGTVATTLWANAHGPQFENIPTDVVFAENRRIRIYLGLGIVSYLVLSPILGNVPTVSSLVAATSGFVVVGLALGCWNAAHRRGVDLLVWMGVVGVIPFVTVAVQGFMGYGLAAAVVVFAFVASFYRANWKTVLSAVLAGYLGLSLYVTYMRDRGDIRDIVWSGSSMGARVEQVGGTFLDFEFFNPSNLEHLYRIDMRLNQDYLVGAAVDFLESNPNAFARGRTLGDALLALIPRALWPDKPISAGSGEIVSDYTGIRFSQGTSVGVGQVLEWYINFGSTGVFLGFTVFGVVLALVDRRAAFHRTYGNWASFATWFLPGIAMLQVGGQLVEVTSSAAAGVVVAMLVARFTEPGTPRVGTRRPALSQPPLEPQA